MGTSGAARNPPTSIRPVAAGRRVHASRRGAAGPDDDPSDEVLGRGGDIPPAIIGGGYGTCPPCGRGCARPLFRLCAPDSRRRRSDGSCAGRGGPGRLAAESAGAGGGACGPRIARPAAAGDNRPRRRGPRHGARRSADRAAPRRRPARRSVVHDGVPASDFIQTEPHDGAPATEKTEVWVSFDRENVYVTVRAWESQPERMIVNEMRRDSQNILQNENFAFLFDTFHDRRNGVLFNINADRRPDGRPGHQRAQYNGDWNPDLGSGGRPVRRRLDGRGGDAVQVAALPSRPRAGLGLQRPPHQPLEERNLVSDTDAAGAGIDGIFQASQAATLVGIEAPGGTRSFEVKPYVISDLSSQAVGFIERAPRRSRRLRPRREVPGCTQSLTADLTYNTDFAQVEADEQQVNLTRFSLFFPEKREFFLENQGLFQLRRQHARQRRHAGALLQPPHRPRRGPCDSDSGRRPADRARRSVTASACSTSRPARTGPGRRRPTSRSCASSATSCAAAASACCSRADRSRRAGPGANDAYGVDGTFAFFDNLTINTYWARTRTDGLDGRRHELSGAARLRRRPLRPAARAPGRRRQLQPRGRLRAARTDMRRELRAVPLQPAAARRSRPSASSRGQAQLDYIENGTAGSRRANSTASSPSSSRTATASTSATATTTSSCRRRSRIAPGVTLPVGGYDFDNAARRLHARPAAARLGQLSVEHGTFYNGHKTTVASTAGA